MHWKQIAWIEEIIDKITGDLEVEETFKDNNLNNIKTIEVVEIQIVIKVIGQKLVEDVNNWDILALDVGPS